jgi:hypothetical protein
MAVTYDDKDVHDELHTSPKGWTTIILDELDGQRYELDTFERSCDEGASST